MGQNSVSPMDLVRWVESLVLSWGENIQARGTEGWTEEQIYMAPEVRAGARLAPDYDASDGTRALEIRFKRRGQGRHRERYLYVKFVPPKRRMDSPRAWRKIGKILRPRRGHQHRRLGIMELSRVIYWSQEVRSEDIKAQILIFLVQLKLVSDETFFLELVKYVRSFRKEVSRDIALDVASELAQHWSFPEDFRAFRKYVSKRLLLAERQLQVLPVEGLQIREEELHSKIGDAESEFEFFDEEENLEDSGKSSAAPTLPTADWMTVQDIASILGVSASYGYKLIKRGALRHDVRDGKLKVPREDIDSISKKFIAKKSKQELQRELVGAGAKPETARKRIYRKFRPLSGPNRIPGFPATPH